MSEDPDFGSGVVDANTEPDLGSKPPGDEVRDGEEGEDADEEEDQRNEQMARVYDRALGGVVDEDNDDLDQVPTIEITPGVFIPRSQLGATLAALARAGGGHTSPDTTVFGGSGALPATAGHVPAVLAGVPTMPGMGVEYAPRINGLPLLPSIVGSRIVPAQPAAAPPAYVGVGAGARTLPAGFDLRRVSESRGKEYYTVAELELWAKALGATVGPRATKSQLAAAIRAAAVAVAGPIVAPTTAPSAVAQPRRRSEEDEEEDEEETVVLPSLILPSSELPSLPAAITTSVYKSYTELLRRESSETEAMFKVRAWISEQLDRIDWLQRAELNATMSPETVIQMARLILNRYWYNVTYNPRTMKILNYVVTQSASLSDILPLENIDD